MFFYKTTDAPELRSIPGLLTINFLSADDQVVDCAGNLYCRITSVIFEN
jgi:hypothetical protein